LLDSITTSDGDPGTVIWFLAGTDVTTEAGTITGLDQVDGIKVGGTVTTTVTEITLEVGTDDGTTLDGTITSEGDPGTGTTDETGTEVTSLAGTITGLEKVDGITVGVTVTTTVIVPMTELGTDDGTTLDGMITIDGWLEMVTTSVDGTEVTKVAGTITGLVKVDGMSVGGTVTVETTVIIVITSKLGTDDGTTLDGTITIDGDPGIVTT
jgi:hypothetical protein